MAAIDDLIAQIEDEALRKRLKEELARLTKDKKFGLVFEEHLPELTPIFSAAITPGNQVARRDRALADVWRVLAVDGGQAHCGNLATGDRQTFATDDLVVIRRFGEPIYPTLVPIDRVQNGPADAPWHTLIEADNYHALQLLEYLYAGQVDCIYIDPPYNTGARDWKYNNDYVDANDRWRHSKWLAMMNRRLKLAKQLLNPRTGVLIVTIDEHEVHHLGMLLERTFPECARQMATIVINQKGVAQGRLSRADEYAIYVFMPDAYLAPAPDDLLSPERIGKRFDTPRWEWLLRGGTNSRRLDRPWLFFPIHIDPATRAIVDIGDPLPPDETPDFDSIDDSVAWPIRTDGSLGNWRVSPPTLRDLAARGYVKLGGYDRKRRTWTVLYLSEKARRQIEEGAIRIVSRNEESGAVDVEYAETQQRNIKTIWHRSYHDSGIYGSSVLRTILGGENNFAFPKSIYATRDAVGAVVRDKPTALVLDFFAGSGTTLQSLEMLNAQDDGCRRCILVTNNEVSEGDAKALSGQGLRPGHPEWERHGISQAVAWPRVKYATLGRRDDGTILEGDYLTGTTTTREKSRTFRQLGFVDPDSLTTVARKKEIAGLIDGVPMSHIKKDMPFFVSEDEQHTAAILFDDTQAGAFVDALEEMDHITHFYIITQSNKLFKGLKDSITELLGPIEIQEEARRPMRDGFPANLEYFRLDFLDKDQVALGRQFRAILPLLWLRAGALGPRPVLPDDDALPALLIPAENPFAVLIDETRFADFQDAVSERDDLTHMFLITDSEDAFQEMAEQLDAPHIIQLYRDYLENFAINRGDSQ